MSDTGTAHSAEVCLQRQINTSNMLYSFRLEVHNSRYSPVYKLPFELLATIMELASGVLDTPQPLSIEAGPSIRTVLALAHVSRRWYQIAKQCPQLWTKILASLAPSLLSMALDRSGDRLLQVTSWSNCQSQIHNESLQELVKHVHRWEVANLVLSAQNLQLITQAPATNLRALAIVPYTANGENPQDLPTPAQLFNGQMPQLESLKIMHSWMDWDQLEYPRLKTLDISVPLTFSTLLKLLSKCPLLETFFVTMRTSIWSLVPEDDSVVTLPHLKTVKITDFAAFTLSELLSRINMPNVESITIENSVALEAFPGGGTALLNLDLWVVIPALRPIFEQLSEAASSIQVMLHEIEGAVLQFIDQRSSLLSNGHLTHREIRLPGILWDNILEILVTSWPSFEKKCTTLKIAGGAGWVWKHRKTVEPLLCGIHQLSRVERVYLCQTPGSARLLSAFVEDGSSVAKKHRLPNRIASEDRYVPLLYMLQDVYLEGCICEERDRLWPVLGTWRDARLHGLNQRKPRIHILDDGCNYCCHAKRAMKALSEEVNELPCSSSEAEEAYQTILHETLLKFLLNR